MKFLTWNCGMALRRKIQQISEFNSDLVVIQECSRADARLLKSIGLELACWTGRNANKGLALFSRAGLKLTAKPIRGVEWAIRGTTKERSPLGIIAMWACATNNSEERYIRQVHKIIDRGVLATMPSRSIFLGDLNSNTIWDGMHRVLNHTRVVEKFELAGYRSAYHQLEGELQGRESKPTFFLHRNKRKPYHIDHAFLSRALQPNLTGLEIGKPSAWLKLSDHMPLSLEIRK